MSKLFLSIDFEDFSHDLGRDLGLWITRPLRVKALTRAYEVINTFLTAHGNARATFFCTGIIAEHAPELVARIAQDGHEVACHYHFHDCIDLESTSLFEHNLQTALGHLRAASGQPVQGFRAPKFRINQQSPEQYQTLAKHVSYDSSFLTGTQQSAKAFAQRFRGLKIVPIYSGAVLPKTPALRLGGTYLKLFPTALTQRLITQAQGAGMVPHIYLHPYEFMSDASFALSREELAPLGAAKATYWLARQHQWHNVGNATLAGKLSRLIGAQGLGGRLDENLSKLAA